MDLERMEHDYAAQQIAELEAAHAKRRARGKPVSKHGLEKLARLKNARARFVDPADGRGPVLVTADGGSERVLATQRRFSRLSLVSLLVASGITRR
jgi:hypothetical protein